MSKMTSYEKFFVNSYWDKIFHRFFGIGKLLKNVSSESVGNILEVGAGVGITSEFIRNKFPNAQFTVTDYDSEQVEKAKKRFVNSNIVVQQADVTRLLFDDQSFNACFAILTFHHVENFKQGITEVYRALKPGGKFYVIDIPAKNWTLFHLRSYKSMNIAPGLFSKDEFEQIVRETGFRLLKTKGNLMFQLIAQK